MRIEPLAHCVAVGQHDGGLHRFDNAKKDGFIMVCKYLKWSLIADH